MPVAGGINAQLGIAEEVTPGTAVTPNRFGEFDRETLIHDIDRVEHSGLRTGRRVLGANNYAVGREKPGGALDLTLQTKGQAVWFKHALGNVVTTTPAGGVLARQHKCTVGQLDGKALTVQVGMNDDTGTARAKTFSGGKIDKWSLEVKENDFAGLTLTLDAISATTTTPLAAASYPTGLADYFGTQSVVRIAGTEVDCKSIRLNVDNGLTVDRYYMRSSAPGRKREQLEGDNLREMKGSLTLAFPDLAAYNRFTDNTQASLQVTLTGPIIEGAIPHSVDVLMPAVRFDGKTPVVDSLGLIPVDLDFVVVDTLSADGPLVVTVVNSDVAP